MNARRRFVLVAFTAMTAIGSAGCYYTTASTTGKSYQRLNPDRTPDRQFAMGDSLGATVWSPVVRERVALARADFSGQSTSTASATFD